VLSKRLLLGKRLRELRRARDLRQQDVAESLKLTASAIGMYERGRRDPDSETLQQLADFFGVSTDYLLGRTEVRGLVETAATSRSDGYDKKLPPEALKSIEEFKEFIRRKYGPKKDKGQDEK